MNWLIVNNYIDFTIEFGVVQEDEIDNFKQILHIFKQINCIQKVIFYFDGINHEILTELGKYFYVYDNIEQLSIISDYFDRIEENDTLLNTFQRFMNIINKTIYLRKFVTSYCIPFDNYLNMVENTTKKLYINWSFNNDYAEYIYNKLIKLPYNKIKLCLKNYDFWDMDANNLLKFEQLENNCDIMTTTLVNYCEKIN